MDVECAIMGRTHTNHVGAYTVLFETDRQIIQAKLPHVDDTVDTDALPSRPSK